MRLSSLVLIVFAVMLGLDAAILTQNGLEEQRAAGASRIFREVF
jgi:hypothetical protein